MFNKTEPILISAANITLFIGITRRYGCFYAFLVKFGRLIHNDTHPGTDRNGKRKETDAMVGTTLDIGKR